MSPRPESIIFIDKQLVWMTCGVEVGYQVLLAPRTSGIAVPSCTDLHPGAWGCGTCPARERATGAVTVYQQDLR